MQNPLVLGRASRIAFPDGRVITVVGHLHGERQMYELAELLNSGELQSMTNPEFDALISRISQKNWAG